MEQQTRDRLLDGLIKAPQTISLKKDIEWVAEYISCLDRGLSNALFCFANRDNENKET